jgi:hypothetical protein
MSVNIQIINQLFEIQQKISKLPDSSAFERNFNKINNLLEDDGFIIQDPTNEPYQNTRTDCEASIIGNGSAKLKITKTLKPIIYKKVDGSLQLLQKAIVIVE